MSKASGGVRVSYLIEFCLNVRYNHKYLLWKTALTFTFLPTSMMPSSPAVDLSLLNFRRVNGWVC